MEVTTLAKLKNTVTLKVNFDTSRIEETLEGLISNVKLAINFDTSMIDETTEKVARLVGLLKEAKSLTDDLASTDLEIKLLVKSP